MEIAWIDDTDGQAAAAALVATRTAQREAEATELALAAHWATLHDEDSLPRGGAGRLLPGAERARQLGGDGTPLVAEFAVAELAVVTGRGRVSAQIFMADSLDVRHRLPQLWTAVMELRVPVWQARKIASRLRAVGLDREQARWVDRQVTPYVPSLPWARIEALLEAKIIEADPKAAAERARAAELEQFVSTGQCNEHGLKTMIVKANAGDVVLFVAMCDRIAQLLLLRGDTSPVGVRRARAVGILADPARALLLLAEHAAGTSTSDAQSSDPTTSGDGTSSDAASDAQSSDPTTSGDGTSSDAASDAESPNASDDRSSSDEAGGVESADAPNDADEGALISASDLHPRDDDSDDAAEGAACSSCGASTGAGRRANWAGTTSPVGDAAAFVKALATVDLRKLMPSATLYVHMAREDLPTNSRGGTDSPDDTDRPVGTGNLGGTGVARVEGIGPVISEQVREWLRHRNVRVVPVIDTADVHAGVDSYEVPGWMRELLRLRGPAGADPWSSNLSRRKDADHTEPYRKPAPNAPGSGPDAEPPQTRVSNLGLLDRTGHRIKTHGRGWKHRQPRPGVYLWRTPHGYWCRVDRTGTHLIGTTPDAYDLEGFAPDPRSAPERVFAELIRDQATSD